MYLYDRKSSLDHITISSIQPLHDLRMVRPPETQRDENLEQLAPHHRHPVFMGNSPLRIHRPGARKQDRLHRQRRSVQHHATQGHPRSDIADSLHTHGNRHVQRTGPAMEPFRRIRMHHSGRFLRLLEINLKIFTKKFGSSKIISTFAIPNDKRSVRITVSTQDSQSCNRGSIPLPTTKKQFKSNCFFSFIQLSSQTRTSRTKPAQNQITAEVHADRSGDRSPAGSRNTWCR